VGGYGSGRQGGKMTAESAASYVLPIASLKSAFQIGERSGVKIGFDEGRFPVVVIVDLRNEGDCFVKLIHPTRDVPDGEQRTVVGKVQLTRTQPTFGGQRWWFLCPRTGHRTNRLFLPTGGAHFWSRKAHGLGYACQREDRLGRLRRRAAALNRQLGGEGWSTWNIPPAKPKRMRWRTYDRKIQRWRRAVERAEDEWVHRALRLLDRREAPGDDRAKRPGRDAGRGVPKPAGRPRVGRVGARGYGA
jgi:hypothetical protein